MSDTGGETRTGPLSGFRVLEFAHVAAGPFAASLLADLGADVVKVESPAGDMMRGWPPHVDGTSANFDSLNRNKRSVVADLKDAEQHERVLELCRRADILIENYRPGVMNSLGLGYQQLREVNPGLIYCSISGYGQTGPAMNRAAFDVAIQAISGLMSVTGHEGQDPVKCGVPVGDFVAGLYAAVCILSMLEARNQSGVGAYIDCPMLATMLAVSALQTSEYFASGQAPRRLGSAHPRNAPYQAFVGSDSKFFVVAAGNDKMWRDLCVALDRPEWIDDDRFAKQVDRVRNQQLLARLLADVFQSRTAAFWIDYLAEYGIATAPVNSFAEVMGDEQVAHLTLVQDGPLRNGEPLRYVRFPVRIDGQYPDGVERSPGLGDHTADVFAEWLPSREASETP